MIAWTPLSREIFNLNNKFFIVQKIDGAYHLDKNYTAFGKVIRGMDVVDKISNLETDKREWPLDNVRFDVEIIQ